MKRLLLISSIAIIASACGTSPISHPNNQKKVDSLVSVVEKETEIANAFQAIATTLTDSAQSKYKSQKTEAMLGCALALVSTSQVFNTIAGQHLKVAEKANNQAKKLNDQDLSDLK